MDKLLFLAFNDGDSEAADYLVKYNVIKQVRIKGEFTIYSILDKKKWNTKELGIDLSCSFDVFWKLYPRKQSKKVCERLWSKIAPDKNLLSEILGALETHKKSEQWANEKYIPMPSTWLNQERWNDELKGVKNEKLYGKEAIKQWYSKQGDIHEGYVDTTGAFPLLEDE